VLQLLSFAAQKEYESIHIRQAQDISAASAKGVRFGRPIKTPPENFATLVKPYQLFSFDRVSQGFIVILHHISEKYFNFHKILI
jgi:DNA invertase Pin-like site-specific DNA recombinase